MTTITFPAKPFEPSKTGWQWSWRARISDPHRPRTQRGQAHVHTLADGRGERVVWLNGRRVKGAIYADTKRGIIRAYRLPLKIDKHNKRCLTYTLRGAVRVEPLHWWQQ